MRLIPINGYEGIYSIREDGAVRVHDRLTSDGKLRKARWLKPTKNEFGYLYVNLTKDKKNKKFKVHRLVASAFLTNKDSLPEVNHKDENKENNHYLNLEWCTRQYNVEYSLARTFLFKSPVGVIHEISNLRKFCRDNKLTQPSMQQVIVGKNTHHKGWTFISYREENK